MLTGFQLTEEDFSDISRTLSATAGIELARTKKSLVYARLAKRLRAVGADTFTAYRAIVLRDEAEKQRMIEALTTNTTSFFREPHHFEHLKTTIERRLASTVRGGGALRIWSAASSTGEEPYSIAMTILNAMPDAERYDIRILATDINSAVLERANYGEYPATGIAELPEALKRRYFEQETEQSYRICESARRLVCFRQLNLQDAWPMRGKFDAVFCRNVMIYFGRETQKALWERFADVLKPGGFFYIGHSERVTGPASLKLGNAGLTTYIRQPGAPS